MKDYSNLLEMAIKEGIPGSHNQVEFWLACQLRDNETPFWKWSQSWKNMPEELLDDPEYDGG